MIAGVAATLLSWATARGRQGIAVEPMTCAPNAFVTGDRTIARRPGQSRTGSFGWRIAG